MPLKLSDAEKAIVADIELTHGVDINAANALVNVSLFPKGGGDVIAVLYDKRRQNALDMALAVARLLSPVASDTSEQDAPGATDTEGDADDTQPTKPKKSKKS